MTNHMDYKQKSDQFFTGFDLILRTQSHSRAYKHNTQYIIHKSVRSVEMGGCLYFNWVAVSIVQVVQDRFAAETIHTTANVGVHPKCHVKLDDYVVGIENQITSI